MKKEITKKEAREKYGVITTGVNADYKYYLLPNGNVEDSDGDIRYIGTISADIKKFIASNQRAVLKNFADYIESMVEAEQYAEMESFNEWIEEEYKIARREKATGEGNYI